MTEITDEMETMVAGILDYPSVYMGGPSQHNRRRARDIVAAVAPLIEAQARERALMEAEEVLLDVRDYLWNPFEPDNQSRMWTRVDIAVRALIDAQQPKGDGE